jgi:hypothetical protein
MMGALKPEDICYTYDDYKLWEGDYESYDFEETTCKLSINFERVFKRFR